MKKLWTKYFGTDWSRGDAYMGALIIAGTIATILTR